MTHTTKHTPGPIDIPTPCSVCGTRGWILARNDTHGLRIERCDECAIMNDSQAWDTAELFLADLLMRFDEGTNLDKATAAPAMYEALAKLRLEAIHYRNTGVGVQFLNAAIDRAEVAINQAVGVTNDTARTS